MNVTWNAERIEQLRTQWADGQSAGQIALSFGVTRNTIIGKIHRLNLPPRPTTKSTRYKYVRTLSREQKAARQAAMLARRIVRELFVRVRSKRSLPPTPPETVITQPEFAPRMIPLLELERGDCRYPFGDGPFLFCGHAATHGRYCAPHYRATHHSISARVPEQTERGEGMG